MSLSRQILYGHAGMLETKNTEDVEKMAEDIKATANDDPTEETYLSGATEALLFDIYTIDKAYMTANVIAEAKVITEGANPEVLLEGIVASGIEKIKSMFKKFWAKLKSWFNEIKRQFKILLLSGKKFINEFKKELRIDKKGFKYTGKEFNIEGGNRRCTDVFGDVIAAISMIIGKLPSIDNKTQKVAFNAGSASDIADGLMAGTIGLGNTAITTDMSQSDIQELYIKSVAPGCTEISELTEELTETYHDGNAADYTTTIEDFEHSGESRHDMIKFIESFDKEMKQVENCEKSFDKTMNSIINAFDKIKELGKNETRTAGTASVDETKYKVAQTISRALTALLAVGRVPCTVQQAVFRDANTQYTRVLKSYLRYKPAKESAYSDDSSSSDSLLEQAMNMLSF